jgi:hypothetical protein
MYQHNFVLDKARRVMVMTGTETMEFSIVGISGSPGIQLFGRRSQMRTRYGGARICQSFGSRSLILLFDRFALDLAKRIENEFSRCSEIWPVGTRRITKHNV